MGILCPQHNCCTHWSVKQSVQQQQQQKIEFYVNGGVRSKIINPMKQILKDQFTYVSLCIIEQEYINIVK